jgi:hypothetical protein
MRFPSPRLAHQVISFILNAWVKQPLMISALIFVPRIMQAFWWDLCRHIKELCTLYLHLTPLQLQPTIPIPVVVLYLPPHQHTLYLKDRLDRPAMPPKVH